MSSATLHIEMPADWLERFGEADKIDLHLTTLEARQEDGLLSVQKPVLAVVPLSTITTGRTGPAQPAIRIYLGEEVVDGNGS